MKIPICQALQFLEQPPLTCRRKIAGLLALVLVALF
jgi:hypothetical protein